MHAISRKTWRNNGEKPHFEPDLGPLGVNSGRNFFKKNLASSVTRYHVQLSACTIPEKTNDPILRKFSDEQTYGQIDRRTRLIL